MDGTTRSDVFSMAGAKNPALGPFAKYSSHALESTTFTRGPPHVERGYRYPSGIRASALQALPGSARCGRRTRRPGHAALARALVSRGPPLESRPGTWEIL